MRLRALISTAALAAVAACSGNTPDAGSDSQWAGTITTEGNVRTVVNESGSVWGGTATLVEEASIGVDVGDAAYMLGDVASIAATVDRIYLLDGNPPVVRIYDMDGLHLSDIGAEGQGPGEFGNPMSMVIGADDRLLVRDAGNDRMTVFSLDGELLETWPLPGGFSTSRESVATPDSRVYLPQSVGRNPETRRTIIGMVPYDAGGTPGEPVLEPVIDIESADLPAIVESRQGGGTRRTIMRVPLFPRPVVVMSPAGAWVAGVGTDYRFEIRYFDGRVTVIERRIEPVPVSNAEADWRRERTVASARSRDPSWSWSGPDVPDYRAYFNGLYPDHSGRIWVQRSGPGIYYPDCREAPAVPPPLRHEPPRPCWRSQPTFEAFGADGRYLGEVEFPSSHGPLGAAFIRGDMVLLPGQDEAGTIMVKRYRLVLPGEQEH